MTDPLEPPPYDFEAVDAGSQQEPFVTDVKNRQHMEPRPGVVASSASSALLSSDILESKSPYWPAPAGGPPPPPPPRHPMHSQQQQRSIRFEHPDRPPSHHAPIYSSPDEGPRHVEFSQDYSDMSQSVPDVVEQCRQQQQQAQSMNSNLDVSAPYDPIDYQPPQDVSSPRQSFPSTTITELPGSPTQWSTANNDSPPSTLLLSEFESAPDVVQVGPGVLPLAFLEHPEWPLGWTEGWEVKINSLPKISVPPTPAAVVPTATPSSSSVTAPIADSDSAPPILVDTDFQPSDPLPINPMAFSISSPAGTSGTGVGALSSTPNPVALTLPPPPTVDEIRASLPQPTLPSGEPTTGATVFDSETFSWWVFKTGKGLPDAAELTSLGKHRLKEFVSLTPGRATSVVGPNAEALNLARHYHLIQGGSETVSTSEKDHGVICCPREVQVFSNVRSTVAMDISQPSTPSPPLDTANSSITAETPSDNRSASSLPSQEPTTTTAPLPLAYDPTPLAPGLNSITPAQSAPSHPAPRPFSPSAITPTLPTQTVHDDLWVSANSNDYLIMPRGPTVKGLFEPEIVIAFNKSRAVDPPPGKDGIVEAWSTILTYVKLRPFLFICCSLLCHAPVI